MKKPVFLTFYLCLTFILEKGLYHYCSKYCLYKQAIDNFQFSAIFLPNPHFSSQNQALRTEKSFQVFPHDNIWCLEYVAPQNIYVAISLKFGPKTGYFDWPIFLTVGPERTTPESQSYYSNF